MDFGETAATLEPAFGELTGRRITLIQAPAGFGKTRLLRRWRQAALGRERQTAWVTLAPADAAPDRFARTVGLALGLDPAPGCAAETIWEALGEQAARDASPRLLFIDDLHWAQQGAAEPLVLGLPRLDPDLHLVAAGRLGGLAGLSRLRATDEAAVIRAEDLRLDAAEARDLVGGHDDPDVEAWIADAEGWPILLRFLKDGLAAGDQPNRLQTIGSVAADLLDGFVADEILAPLEPDLRAFLLRTSVVSEVDAALGALLHGGFAGDLIERLTRRRGLMALEPRSGRFRVNPLLRQSLLRRHTAADGPDIQAQQQAVHEHLMATEAFDQAALHACDVGDFATCLALFRKISPSLLTARYGLKTMRRLLARIPAGHFRSDPALRLSRALLLSKEGRIRDARRLVGEVREEARLRVTGGELGEGRSELVLLDATLALQSEAPISAELGQALEALAGQLPPTDHLHQGWLYNMLCRLKFSRGDLEGAAAAAMLAERYNQDADAKYGEFFIHLHLGSIRFWQGRLAQAIAAFDQAEQLVHRHFNGDRTLAATVRLLKAEPLLDLSGSAGESLAHDLRLSEENDGWLDVFLGGYRVEALRLFHADAPEAALDVLRRAGETAARGGMPRLRNILRALQIELLTFAGRRGQAAALLRQARRASDGAGGDSDWRERIPLGLAEARLMLHLRQYKRACTVLDSVEAECAAMGAGRPLLKARILRALLLAASDARRQAVDLLTELLAGDDDEPPVWTFLEEGEAMARLCALAVRLKGALAAGPEALERLRVLHLRLADAAAPPAGEGPGEPLLTAREREVLHSLSKGWSNKVAAERLNVTEATVKFHLRRIYRKLGAPNRVTALAIARQHDLLT